MNRFARHEDRLSTHYRRCLATHGPNADGVDWRDEKKANRRHRVMTRLLELDPIAADGDEIKKTSLLDLGCGYGAFAHWLADNRPSGMEDLRYIGVDIVPEMLEHAKQMQPNADWLATVWKAGSAFTTNPAGEQVDYAVCNGLFTQKLDADRREAENALAATMDNLFENTNRGFAINIMSSSVNYHADNLFYKSPSEIFGYCTTRYSRNVSIHNSYGLFEFTTFVYHDTL